MPSTEARAGGSAGTSSPSSDEGPGWRDSSRSSEPLTRLRPQPAGTDSNTNTGSQHTGSGNGSGGDSGGDGSRSGRSSDNSDTTGRRVHGRTQPRTNAHRSQDAWSDTNAVRGTPALPTAPAAPSSNPGAPASGSSDEPLPPALLPPGASQRPRSDSRAAPGAPEAGSNLFVAGMPSTVDDEALAAVFAPYGTVLSAKVMLHVDTAASRGFGFVLFATAAEAERAREALHGTAIAGHGGRLQVSVSKHRGENLTAESRVVYIRHLPACLLGSDELATFLGGFGPVDRVTSRPGSDAQHGGAPNCTNVVVTFGSVEAARACVAACHGKTPFAHCAVPLLSKMEEPQTLREQRLREQRSLPAPAVPVADASMPLAAVSLPHAPPPPAAARKDERRVPPPTPPAGLPPLARLNSTDPGYPPAVGAAPSWPVGGLNPLPPFPTTGVPTFPLPPPAPFADNITASMANAPVAPAPFPSTLPPAPAPYPMGYPPAAPGVAMPPFGMPAFLGAVMPPLFQPQLPQQPSRPY